MFLNSQLECKHSALQHWFIWQPCVAWNTSGTQKLIKWSVKCSQPAYWCWLSPTSVWSIHRWLKWFQGDNLPDQISPIKMLFLLTIVSLCLFFLFFCLFCFLYLCFVLLFCFGVKKQSLLHVYQPVTKVIQPTLRCRGRCLKPLTLQCFVQCLKSSERLRLDPIEC